MVVNNRNPEGIAVELYFDDETEHELFAFRDSVYQKGIQPVLGLMNDKPHISLAVFSKVEPKSLCELAKQFSQEVLAFECTLSALGVFPTVDNVLFLYPIPTCHLLEIHAKFHQMIKDANIPSVEYYQPGNWIPHCTLEFNLEEDQLEKAVTAGKNLFTPITGSLTGVGVVGFRPIEYLGSYQLREKE